MNRRPMTDVGVLNGCDGSSVCTTCGGLRMLNVTLMRHEAAVPG